MRRLIGTVVAVLTLALAQPVAKAPRPAIQDYIKLTWGVLTRSNRDLAKAAVDPKFHALPNGRWPVYIPQNENLKSVESSLSQEMGPIEFAKVELRALPQDTSTLTAQGLLYLPRPYVVPGGRFNEMYGWDSYFIQLGLLRDHETALAKDMADNFLYEIRNY